ncbi:MAG TPA: glycosyltransferase 87 family protein [Chloroflexia bacterium]|nr:glycosyltransferase 87 family protein [Chloroflexia bacterium]
MQNILASRLFSPKWLRWCAHALLLALLLVVWRNFTSRDVVPAMGGHTWPYSAYWITPRLALDGHASVIYAGSSVYGPHIDQLNVSADLLEVNLPTTWLPFLALALLPIDEAFHIWTVISLACFIVGWLVLLWAVRLPLGVGLLLTTLVPFFEPVAENIDGQTYLAIFALVSISAVVGFTANADATSRLRNESRRRQVVGGVLLGVAGLFKLYYALVLALPALIKRRYLFLASAAITTTAAIVTTLWAWGLDPWARAIPLSLSWKDRPETVHTAYQTTNSLIGGLFRYEEEWSPVPVIHLPWLAESLWWLVTLTTVAITLLAIWRFGRRDEDGGRTTTPAWYLLGPSSIVPLASALAPIAESYHYALCLFPAVVVVAVLYEAWRHRLAPATRGEGNSPWASLLVLSAALVLALVLLGAQWNFNVARADGWERLLHYPRLYGGLLLWLVSVLLLMRPAIITGLRWNSFRILGVSYN